MPPIFHAFASVTPHPPSPDFRKRNMSLCRLAGLAVACLCASSCFSVTPLFAQAAPTRVYEGHVGGQSVELSMLEDYHVDSLKGYLLEKRDGRLLTLEETPHKDGEPMTIDVLDARAMPFAAIALRPFSKDDRKLRGEWIDLRNRARRPIEFEKTAFFTPDSDKAYDGEILQASGDAPFLFRVHARRMKGEYGGLVDRIDIHDRASGRRIQTIDHLILNFNGTATLEFGDYNGDGRVDFRARRLAISVDGARATGAFPYYLFTDNGFHNFAPLDELESNGAVAFPAPGQVEMRPEDKVDFENRIETWQRYRFVTPEKLELQGSDERPFGS
jgi:hypothetical protein